MRGFFGLNKKGGGSRESHNYGLTPLGKKKAESFSETTPKNKVISFLNENGVSTTADIASGIGVSPQKADLIIKSLRKDGYVRPVGQDEE